MYHIKDDKRALTSAELIYDGLCQCLKKKSFARITVSDIQKASTVSRATFYRHFDTIDDVLYWRCDQCFAEMLTSYEQKNTTAYDFTYHFIDYWSKNSEILELLMQINRIDIIYTCHVNNLAFFQEIGSNTEQILREHGEYFLGMRTGILVGILMAWLKNGKKESAEEIFQIIQTQFEFIRESKLII